MQHLTEFSQQLAQQLLHLADKETGKEVPLDAQELEQVGRELVAIARGIIDRTLDELRGH